MGVREGKERGFGKFLGEMVTRLRIFTRENTGLVGMEECSRPSMQNPGFNPEHHTNQVWWWMPVIQAFGRWRLENQEFKAILVYI